MMTHPYDYKKLIAARHTQIQHDMQLSRVQPHTKEQRTIVQPIVDKLETKICELSAQQQRTEQQSKELLRAS
jgi:hypothetical protein